MKKILLINNENDVKEYLDSKVSYNKIIVLTYESAIICDQKNIKFTYIKDIYKIKDKKISKLFYNSYETAKKIDRAIIRENIVLKKYNFFTNYFNFTKANIFIGIYDEYFAFLIKKFPAYKIYYFNCHNYNYFDFFTECIKLYKDKNKFLEIKPLSTNYKNNYFNLSDDPNVSIFKKIIINFKNLNFYNKKTLLFYLVSNPYAKKIKMYGIAENKNIYQYISNIKKINFVVKLNLKCPLFAQPKKKLKLIFLQKYINYVFPYIINEVLNAHKNLDNSYNKKKIFGFITQHDTLISNTIKQYLNFKNIKTLTLLHGGTLSHFNNSFFWPTLVNANLNTNNIAYFQNYSDFHNTISKLQNLKFNVINKKNIIYSFPNENFLNLRNTHKSDQKKIAYISQSNNNVLAGKLQNNNDFYKLYLSRNIFLKKIFSLKDFEIHASHTENNVNYFANKLTIEFGLKKKKIFISKFNAIEILKKSYFAVFEQPSTTLIEALLINVPVIIVIKNPLLKFNLAQEVMLKKRVYFVDNLNQAIKIIKGKYIIKKDSTFIEKFYPTKTKNNFYKVFKDLFR